MADEPTPDQLVEELRRAKVSDLLVHTLSMVASMGFAKLAPDGRDLEQARIAIEALKALLPVLEGNVEEAVVRDFGQVLANLQLAYADAAKADEPV
ncbi:MAG TPA: hypothetical protein VMT59_03160 [Gaiellaceae bacterium]|nr:hypothetical protein [Gaiellaceae bacterium]